MIYVFKTSVKSEKDIQQLKPYLNRMLSSAIWNFDLEDNDRIFRVDTSVYPQNTIIQLLLDKGFDCEELNDL